MRDVWAALVWYSSEDGQTWKDSGTGSKLKVRFPICGVRQAHAGSGGWQEKGRYKVGYSHRTRVYIHEPLDNHQSVVVLYKVGYSHRTMVYIFIGSSPICT